MDNPPTELSTLDLDICTAIDNLQTIEEMIEFEGWMSRLTAVIAEAKRAKAARFVELLEGAGGSFELADKRYYIGSKKKVKPNGNWQIMEALLEQTGGDPKQIAGCMASSAWKQAAIKELVGEEKHKELFTTTTETDIKTGKPKKEIKSIPKK